MQEKERVRLKAYTVDIPEVLLAEILGVINKTPGLTVRAFWASALDQGLDKLKKEGPTSFYRLRGARSIEV